MIWRWDINSRLPWDGKKVHVVLSYFGSSGPSKAFCSILKFWSFWYPFPYSIIANLESNQFEKISNKIYINIWTSLIAKIKNFRKNCAPSPASVLPNLKSNQIEKISNKIYKERWVAWIGKIERIKKLAPLPLLLS